MARICRRRGAADGGRAPQSDTTGEGRQDGQNTDPAAAADRGIDRGRWAQDADKGAVVQEDAPLPLDRARRDQNKVGPELNGLDGRHSGRVASYSYSDANKNSGIVWNEATFKQYIQDPKAKVPGTKMIFAGIKNQQEVNNLWAYVKQFDADGNIKK